MNDMTKMDLKDLEVVGNPQSVVTYAEKVASMLKDIVVKKPKPVMIKGEQYLEFEDWQLMARFYKVTVQVDWSKEIREKDLIIGYEARASVITKDGRVITSAESMCLKTEAQWMNKDLFQLRSMAQTRACAKAYRNIFSYIVVLAGYKPSVAEEM